MVEVSQQEWDRLIARIAALEQFREQHYDPTSSFQIPHPKQLLNTELVLFGAEADPTANLYEGQLRFRSDLDVAKLYAAAAWHILLMDNDTDWVDLTDGGATTLHTHSGGSLKTASGGYFLIPTGPSAGTTVADSASANTYGSWVQMTASAPADLFIVAIRVGIANVTAAVSYTQIDIGTGAAASETSVGEFICGGSDSGTDSGIAGHTIILPFPIPVASGTRIACRTADNVASSHNYLVTLICINQADLVAI